MSDSEFVKLSATVKAEQLEWLEKRAEVEDRKISAIVRRIINNAMKDPNAGLEESAA